MTEKNEPRVPAPATKAPSTATVPPLRPSIPAGVTRADRRRVAELAQHVLRD